MTHFKRIFFFAALLTSSSLRAQDCKCLTMSIVRDSAASVNKKQVQVLVKNNCNIRRWLYTPAFWIRKTEPGGGAKTSVIHRLHSNNLPEFLLFKWKEEKVLTFDTDAAVNDKVEISYENTDHIYPSRLLGSKTYTCSKVIGDLQ
ncbi:MAG: hypothetical protein EOP56_19050 [Sphingobacteriales bacterium]|nr:MAG: hypothetical protein EOP56_19050 [Sphingobacteriales bacterium]